METTVLLLLFICLAYLAREFHLNKNRLFKDVYYVNLTRRPDRDSKTRHELNKSKYLRNKYQRVPAVDGRQLRINGIPRNKMGWIGCARSHIGIWKKIMESDRPALIFEDDIFLKSNFDKTLSNCMKDIPKDFDIIYIMPDKRAVREKYNESFDKIADRNYSTCAYVVSPVGAMKLIRYLTPYKLQNQIDIMIAIYTKFGYFNCYSMREWPVWTYQDNTSDVQLNFGNKVRYIGKEELDNKK